MLLLIAFTVQAQFWQKKPPSEWSLQECYLIAWTADSPWVSASAVGTRKYPGTLPAGEIPLDGPYLRYTATIVSAWTVQRALVRMVELGGQGKTPSNTEASALVRRLGETYSDTVVLRIAYQGSRGLAASSTAFWKSKSQDELVRRVVLITDGKRTQAIRIETEPSSGDQAGGFQAVFPRKADGGPLLTSNTKKVYLEIDEPNAKIEIRFDVKKMMVRGELVY